MDYLTDNCRKSQFNSLLNSYNLFSIVDFGTGIQNTSKSAIDNIAIDYSRLGTFKVTPIPNGVADHMLNSFSFMTLHYLSFPKAIGKQGELINVH